MDIYGREHRKRRRTRNEGRTIGEGQFPFPMVTMYKSFTTTAQLSALGCIWLE